MKKFIRPLNQYLALFLLILISGCGFFEKQEKMEQQLVVLQAYRDSVQGELQILRQENSRLREAMGDPIPVGFEVQIGAFEYFDMAKYEEYFVRFDIVEVQGLEKYVLGRFSKLEEATAFLKDVQKIGVQDAFIAGVVNGKRTTVEEAEEIALEYYGFD